MSYQVLARKWRPQNFDQMVGQKTSIQALRNAIKQQRLHHAYLFSGTRGVGKTTIARVMAKCLNCEQGMTDCPCEQCHHCQAINSGNFVDLLEIDAASRTKVEDTRDLLNNVQYRPAQGRYKVYLIDEVHMLSGHSFNALLKTLEEPPAHVIFLLATTDPDRLPITVLSRCLQFHLKSIHHDIIAQHLTMILTQENIVFEPEGLHIIATAAKGSMRDALSLLDQAIAFSGKNIKASDINQMLGFVDQQIMQNILLALANKDGNTLIQQSRQLAEHGADFHQALTALLNILHELSLQQAITDYSIEASLTQLTKVLSAEDTQLFYQIALLGQRDLPLAPSPQMGFEMTLLRMLNFCPSKVKPKTFTVPNPVTSAPTPIVAKQSTKAADAASSTVYKPDNEQHSQSDNAALAQKTTFCSDWWGVIKELNLSPMTRTLAEYTIIDKQDENNIVLLLDPQQQALLNNAQQQRLNQALNAYYAKPIKLTINTAKTPLQDCPAQHMQQQRQASHQQAKQSLENDENVNALIKQFDAKIIEDSIHVT